MAHTHLLLNALHVLGVRDDGVELLQAFVKCVNIEDLLFQQRGKVLQQVLRGEGA